ncbi:MAG: hypothetical protein ACYSUQ_13530, partial [Planctomycetota bacterium]
GATGRFCRILQRKYCTHRPKSLRHKAQQGTFTTQSAGELNLHLYMAWVDPTEQLIVDMETQALFEVAEPSN